MKRLKYILSAIVAGIFWGLISIFTRGLSNLGLTTLQISGIRMLVATIFILITVLLINPKYLIINIKDIWMFCCSGILGIVLMNYFYVDTIINSEVSFASVMIYTAPIFVMIASVVFFKEKITIKKVGCLILTIIGCILVAGILERNCRITLRAIITGLLSGISYASYSVIGKIALKKYNTFTVTLYSFLMGTIIFAFLVNIPFTVKTTFTSLKGSLNALGLGLICTVGAFLLYSYSLKGLEASKSSIIVSIDPLIGCIIGFCLFNEQLTIGKIIGIVLILISIILLNVNIKQKGEKCKTTI